MSGDVLVAGVGNIFLRDDGFGPEVVRHIQTAQPPLPSDVRLVDYGIRGVHLCYDLLEGYRALIIVDALPGDGRPGEVSVLSVGPGDLAPPTDDSYDAHGMHPVAVLAGLPALGGTLPPTYVVGARPADLGEGIGLSEEMMLAVPVAGAAVRGLLAGRPWLRAGHDADHEATGARK